MGRLKIGGIVRYPDLTTPAKDVLVRIYDLDTGGNGTDMIFEQRTGADGRFSGMSGDWVDSNSIRIPTPLGAIQSAVPDIMLLEVRVDYQGETHRGPFMHIGDSLSAPIVLPSFPVKKSEREVLQVITLSPGMQDKALYDLIEFGSRALGSSLTAGHYRTYSVLEAEAATLERLCEKLDALTSRPEIEAVDLILCTHGSTNKVVFFPDDAHSMDSLAQKLKTIAADRRKKLRAVFSTACFGATHLDTWLDTGFKVASGSVGIYADSALSFPAFLATWGSGATFGSAVSAANAADPGRLQDAIARDYFESKGEHVRATQVNSVRRTKGNTSLRIGLKS